MEESSKPGIAELSSKNDAVKQVHSHSCKRTILSLLELPQYFDINLTISMDNRAAPQAEPASASSRTPEVQPMRLYGIDFTSAPSRRKAITVASGVLVGGHFVLRDLAHLHDFEGFERWLRQPGPWLGVFDLPFSLPRELVETLDWPTRWPELIAHVAAQTRPQLRETFKQFCDARATGNKFAHRATDGPAGSSSSMKWVNPPVAYMLHAGVPRLVEAGVTVFGMHPGDPDRIALEGYPGLVARSITRASYKNDEVRKQTPERRAARASIISALQAGDHPFGIRLDASPYLPALLDDGSADLLDAVLCGVLAAWAWQRRDARFGLPAFDPLEGWIVGS